MTVNNREGREDEEGRHESESPISSVRDYLTNLACFIVQLMNGHEMK
jgi:hypothetical protein